MTRRYCSGTLSNENDSLDGRQDGGVGGAQAPPSGGAGRVEEAWETVQIPCVHFVNYNSECLDYHNAGFPTTLDGGLDPTAATHWTEMNIEETMAVLTRCSFDEQHRQPIFNLGGIPALAELIQVKSFVINNC